MNGYGKINQVGDKTREWLNFVRRWKVENPPLDNGCYVCGICGRFVLADEVTLDHIRNRSGNPGLVLDKSNIQPAHSFCNYSKGSRHLEPKFSAEQYDFMNWMSKM